MLVRLDSRASTDSPFLGTGSDKVKGQSDTFLTAGSVFFMCRYGTLDSQCWYVQCSPGQYRIKNVVYLDEKCSGFYQLKGDFSSLF